MCRQCNRQILLRADLPSHEHILSQADLITGRSCCRQTSSQVEIVADISCCRQTLSQVGLVTGGSCRTQILSQVDLVAGRPCRSGLLAESGGRWCFLGGLLFAAFFSLVSRFVPDSGQHEQEREEGTTCSPFDFGQRGLSVSVLARVLDDDNKIWQIFACFCPRVTSRRGR